MQLENISYSKEFLNALLEILNIKKTEVSEDKLNDIEKYVFILEKRIISEYDKIKIEIEDNIHDGEDISIETSEFVKKTLRLFSQINGFLKEDEFVAYKSNHKLIFSGFDDHNGIEEYYGAVDYAEYIIKYKNGFKMYEDIYKEGTSSDTIRYIEALNFFENKEVNKDSILEFVK